MSLFRNINTENLRSVCKFILPVWSAELHHICRSLCEHVCWSRIAAMCYTATVNIFLTVRCCSLCIFSLSIYFVSSGGQFEVCLCKISAVQVQGRECEICGSLSDVMWPLLLLLLFRYFVNIHSARMRTIFIYSLTTLSWILLAPRPHYIMLYIHSLGVQCSVCVYPANFIMFNMFLWWSH